MTVTRDVDKFWQELNKKVIPGNRSSAKAGVRAGRSSGKHAGTPPKLSDQFDQSHQSLVNVNSSTVPDCSGLDLDGIERRMQRDLQALKDPVATVRSRALQNINVRGSALLSPSLKQ